MKLDLVPQALAAIAVVAIALLAHHGAADLWPDATVRTDEGGYLNIPGALAGLAIMWIAIYAASRERR